MFLLALFNNEINVLNVFYETDLSSRTDFNLSAVEKIGLEVVSSYLWRS